MEEPVSPALPPLAELAEWLNRVPEEQRYAFVARWIRDHAQTVGRRVLADALPAGHRQHGNEDFFKALLSFNLSDNRLTRVARKKAGILARDVDDLCDAINALNAKARSPVRVSKQDFYHAAWTQFRASVALPSPALAQLPFDERYRKALALAEYWNTIPSVFHGASPMDVSSLYVELRLVTELDRHINVIARHANAEQDFRYQSIPGHYLHPESLLARMSGRILIVGPPGSGKSTLLKWVCNALLKESRSPRLPVPVRLRAFADTLQRGERMTLTDFALRQLGVDTDVRQKQHQVSRLRNNAVFLLDGWDEVPVGLRAVVRTAIERDTVGRPTLITSRPSGTPDLLRDTQTEFYELGPLTDHAVVELCRNYGEQRGKRAMMNELLTLLESTPALWPVAGNPYLLTLLCEVIFRRGEMPHPATWSPHWVIDEAKNLMFADYNRIFPDQPLGERDEHALERLAVHLSFNAGEKHTVFGDTLLHQCLGHGMQPAAILQSRFLSGTTNAKLFTVHEFAHLKWQEYFAASGVLREEQRGHERWISRLLLSTVWLEESGHILAMAKGLLRARILQQLRSMLQEPDLIGEIPRRIAKVLSMAGAEGDDGRDLKKAVCQWLWRQLTLEKSHLRENIQALLQLDAAFVVAQAQRYFGPLTMNERSAHPLLDQLCRLMPLGMRQRHLDALLLNDETVSWMKALPAPAFPTPERMDETLARALDETLPLAERQHAVRELGAARAASAVDALILLLRHEEAGIASVVAEVLGKIGGRNAAVALVRLLLDNPWLPDSVRASTLNALSLQGYGILEPHSRDMLIAAVASLPPSPQLQDVLTALAGTPVPTPPERLFELISEAQPDRELAELAMQLLRGIFVPAFLSRVLACFVDLGPAMRRHLLAACPFIPADCPGIDSLWMYFRQAAPGSNEQYRWMTLFVRTLKQYPNHPLASRIQAFAIDGIAQRSQPEQAQQLGYLLRHIEVLAGDGLTAEALLAIALEDSVDIDAKVSALDAAQSVRLDPDQLDQLHALFVNLLPGDGDDRLLEALGNLLAGQNPVLAPGLMAALARRPAPQAGRESGIAVLLLRKGYLVFEDRILTPQGLFERALPPICD